MVPAVVEVCLPQAAHSQVHGLASSFQPLHLLHAGQTKPFGQRRRANQSAHAASSGNVAMNCCSDGGRSCFQRLI